MSTRFEGKIRAPETNTYTFLVHHDDGARLYIDNVMVFEDWTSGAVSDTVDANLTLNQEYQIKLEHFESGGPGSLWLYWSYGSVSEVNITFETNHVSSPSVVSGSPFTVTVLPSI